VPAIGGVNASKLGLIAGGGDLPLAIVRRLLAEGRPFHIIRLKGFADPALDRHPGQDSGMAEIGAILKSLQQNSCDAVCLAGNVSRPDFRDLKPDFKGALELPGIVQAATRGDDALLRRILSIFEAEGFAVEGADDILGGDTLPLGALGRHSPSADDRADLAKALHVAARAGELDIGQGAVVAGGLVLAVEAQEGTDAMLIRVADLPQALRGHASARRGVLAKAPKPIQDLRVDMPVIGARTVEGAAAAGLAGIAGLSGRLILIDRPAIVAAADRLGLFVWGET